MDRIDGSLFIVSTIYREGRNEVFVTKKSYKEIVDEDVSFLFLAVFTRIVGKTVFRPASFPSILSPDITRVRELLGSYYFDFRMYRLRDLKV